MNAHKGAAIGIMLLLGMACSSMPDTSRTGQIHDVKIIESQLQPTEVSVRPGDEVRWLNYRTKPVRIIFLDRLDEALLCERGFSGSGKNDTTIKASKAVSLCFAKPGQYRYTARMEAEVAGGEIPVAGTVYVQ
jgi:plastocyanin